MTVLKAEAAARLAKVLFPNLSSNEVLPLILEWLQEFSQEFAKDSNISLVVPPTPPTKPTPATQKIPPGFKRYSESTPPKSDSNDQNDQRDQNTPAPAVLQLKLEGGQNETPEILMATFLAYAKENRLNANQLAKKAGVSYPTMLSWMKTNKVPRGNNIDKIRSFLSQAADYK